MFTCEAVAAGVLGALRGGGMRYEARGVVAWGLSPPLLARQVVAQSTS